MKQLIILLFMMMGCSQVFAAPATIENYETKGQWRTKINAGFSEHETEISTNTADIATNTAAIASGTGLSSQPTAADQTLVSSGVNLYDWVEVEDWTAADNISLADHHIAVVDLPWEFCFALSDETTALTTGTAKVTFRMPFAATLTWVRTSVNTAPVGSSLNVDVNEGGTSVFSTVLTIDTSEKTSYTAATAAVISDSSLANDAELTFDIDQVGSTTAGAGLKCCIGGTR